MLADAVNFDSSTKFARCHTEYSRAVAATVPGGYPKFFSLYGSYYGIPDKSTFDRSPCSDNVCGFYIYVGNAEANENIIEAGTPIYCKYAWDGECDGIPLYKFAWSALSPFSLLNSLLIRILLCV